MAENNNEQAKPCFRWLHISDLHVPGDATYTPYKDFFSYLLQGNKDSCDTLEAKGMEGIIEDYCGVDCIVITGDLFNRGDISVDAERHIEEIVNLIYQLCAEYGEWNEDESMTRLCYCPGNHDLARDERIRNRIGNHSYFYRQDVISEPSSVSGGYLSIDNQYKKELVVHQTFEIFHSAMEKIARNPKVYNIENGQIMCFEPEPRDNRCKRKILMVGLNTSLLAGQVVVSADDIPFKSYEENTCEKIESCLKSKNYSAALSIVKELIERYQTENGEIINDDGKMCLPEQKAMKKLYELISNKQCIPILFGHHGIDFLTDEAQQELNSVINAFNIPVYLCGHAHQIRNAGIGGWIYSQDPSSTCLEVTAGGLFWDNTGYNQIGFSVGTIEFDDDDSFTTIIDHYTCVQYRENQGSNQKKAGIWTHGSRRKKTVLKRTGLGNYRMRYNRGINLENSLNNTESISGKLKEEIERY